MLLLAMVSRVSRPDLRECRGSSPSRRHLLRSFLPPLLQRQRVGGFTKAVVLLDGHAVFLPEEEKSHVPFVLASNLCPFHDFRNNFQCQCLGDLPHAPVFVEDQQVIAFPLLPDRLHPSPSGCLQDSNEFLERQCGFVVVLWCGDIFIGSHLGSPMSRKAMDKNSSS